MLVEVILTLESERRDVVIKLVRLPAIVRAEIDIDVGQFNPNFAKCISTERRMESVDIEVGNPELGRKIIAPVGKQGASVGVQLCLALVVMQVEFDLALITVCTHIAKSVIECVCERCAVLVIDVPIKSGE